MSSASRHDKSLLRSQLYRPVFQIDDEKSCYDVEEFVEIIVLVPMILAFHYTKADNRFVYPAQGLIEPGMPYCINDLRQINYLQVVIENVEVCFVGIRVGCGHRRT